MLSLELEDKLIGEDITAVWSELKQKYLPNGLEEAILLNSEAKKNKYNYPGANFSFIYDGTDEDFIKKYNTYVSTWTRDKYIKELEEKYGMIEIDACFYTDLLEDTFWDNGYPKEIK